MHGVTRCSRHTAICTASPASGFWLVMRPTLRRMQRRHTRIMVILIANVLLINRLFRLHRRCKFRLLPEFLAKKVKADRNWDADDGNAAEKRCSPFDPKVVEHLTRE